MNKLEEIKNKKNGIIDCHCHAGIHMFSFSHLAYPAIQNMEDLIYKSRAVGVDWLVCSASPIEFSLQSEPFSTERFTERFPFEIANHYLLMETEIFGENVLPFAIFNPSKMPHEQCDQIKEWQQRYGLYGLKLPTLPTGCKAIDVADTPFVELLRQMNWPLLIHSGRDKVSHPANALEFAKRHPDIRVCIAHNARFIEAVWINAIRHQNIFIDVSPFLLSCIDTANRKEEGILSLNYDFPHQVIFDLYKFLPERLLWGTDEPWTKILRVSEEARLIGANYAQEKNFLDSLDSELRNAIAWRNPRVFLGIA